MTEPTLILSSECLLSKWGFGDGDIPDALDDWLDEHHHDLYRSEDRIWRWHDVLRVLVRRYLLPVLTQRVELVDVETIHNPIRAMTVDGVDMEDCWYNRAIRPVLTPDAVQVPYSEVVNVIRELASRSPSTESETPA